MIDNTNRIRTLLTSHDFISSYHICIFSFILILFALIIYSQTFYHELIFLDDDIIVYQRFEDLSNLGKFETAFTSNYLGGKYYRPVTLLSFIVDSELVKDSLFIYHLTNFLIHLFTCVILFAILKNLKYSFITTLICSLFFTLDPIHINAIGWIAGRGDLLAGFFSLTALFFFIKFLDRTKFVWLFLVTTFLLLAIFSKEASFPVPFLLLIFLFIKKKDFSLSKANIGTLIMVLIVVSIYYSVRLLLPEVHIDKFSFTAYYSNFLLLPETISKFFIPFGIKALPRIELFTSVSGLVILLILISLPIKLKNINKPRYYFGMTWFILLMLPGMLIKTMGQDGLFYWDCRSYLPLFGLALTIAEVLKSIELSRYKKRIYYITFIYILVIAVSTFLMLKIYKDASSYWGTVKHDYPESFLPYVGLFNYYGHFKNYPKAESQLLSAIKLRPEESSVRQTLINFYLQNGDLNKAFNFVKRTVLEDSFNSDFYLEKLISLSRKTNQLAVIDKLKMKYSDENIIIEKINKFLMSSEQSVQM